MLVADDKIFRGFCIWRKDLCHINKTRDNHLARLGSYFHFTLLVKESAALGDHVAKYGTVVRRVKVFLPGLLGNIEFYLRGFFYLFLQQVKEPFDFIHSPIGEEPIGYLYKLIVPRRPLLVMDLWDVPGLSVIRNGSALKESARKFYQRLLPWLVNRADCVIAGVVVDGLYGYVHNQQFVILSENAVFLDSFSQLDGNPGTNIWSTSTGTLRLIYTGYVHPARGACSMIHLVAALHAKGIPAELALVGPTDPDAKSQLENVCERLEVNEYIKFIGSVDSGHVPAILDSADICFSPLLDEEKFRWSYPVKIYEYMAVGKAIVASDLPGTRALIQHGCNGMLYSPGDVDALTDIVIRLYSDPELRSRLGKQAQQDVQARTWDSVIQRLATELTNFLCRRKAKSCN